jgi:hypothetical protein
MAKCLSRLCPEIFASQDMDGHTMSFSLFSLTTSQNIIGYVLVQVRELVRDSGRLVA